MPDSGLAQGFLLTATETFAATGPPPSEANLRRIISTCYYAVFHALAKCSADCLIGEDETNRSNKAWVEVYRGLEHNHCKKTCEHSRKIAFPAEIKSFAKAFIQLQSARHDAHYNPNFKPTVANVALFIDIAKKSVNALEDVEMLDRRAFATWILINSGGAKRARAAELEDQQSKSKS